MCVRVCVCVCVFVCVCVVSALPPPPLRPTAAASVDPAPLPPGALSPLPSPRAPQSHSSRIRDEVVAYKKEIATVCEEYFSSGDIQVRVSNVCVCVRVCVCVVSVLARV